MHQHFTWPELLRICALLFVCGANVPMAWSAATLYAQPAYESPERGDPDDLLLIPGLGLSAGDKIVYQAVANTTQLPAHPGLPDSNTAQIGRLDLVSAADAPYASSVHLPAAMIPGQSYAIWVVSPDGSWSQPILINDARPLWITPDHAFQTANLANLPRLLKVVGRSLEPPAGNSAVTQVRLVGSKTGTTYTLPANNTNSDPDTTAAVQRYVAAAPLPASITPDTYTVQVSRDGASWVGLLGNGQSAAQVFTVYPDTPSPKSFPVLNYADPTTGLYCTPNSGADATGCIIAAIRAAIAAGGGTVEFGPGTWLMSSAGTWPSGRAYSDRLGIPPASCASVPPQTCGVSWFGVLLPGGVNIQGAGAEGPNATVIERGPGWVISSNGFPPPLFTAMGNNTVSGIDFVDGRTYSSSSTPTGPLLQLGMRWDQAHFYSNSDPLTVSNVVISQNLFDKPWIAIGNGGLPMDHIFITNNAFGGAYTTAISLSEDPNSVGNLTGGGAGLPYQTYHFNDSVISYNTFYPSSLNNVAANGTMATGLNSGTREDFSNNVSDGRVNQTQYLYDPSADATGWRAGHFFTPGTDTEMLLVSNNYLSCTGDKSNDNGEGIAFDGSYVAGGLPVAEGVIESVPWTDLSQGIAGTSITLQGSLVTTIGKDFQGNPFDIAANPTPYYRGFWAQVVSGAGRGQWRKVVSVSLGSNSSGATVTLNVTPAFDVLPDASSLVTLTRAYWQVIVVNNQIEQRKTVTDSEPLCTKANSLQMGGVILLYASTADSVIEGNQQFDTDGIQVAHTYQPATPYSTQYPAGLNVQSSNQVRNNLVQGEYDWPNAAPNSSNGKAGIQLVYGAGIAECNGGTCTNTPSPPPPVLGFGLTISGNTVMQAQTLDPHASYAPLGAIGMGAWGWYGGPVDAAGQAQWELGADTLVFHNQLQNISGAGRPQIGIGVDNFVSGTTGRAAPIAWKPTLYANVCSNVDVPIFDVGASTIRYCPASASTTCECAGVNAVDMGIAASSDSILVAVGGSTTFDVQVTNNSLDSAATGVVVSVTPPAGVQITSLAPSPSCDAAVNLCNLGDIGAGQSATVTIGATVPAAGTYPVVFSVTHRDSDNVPANDGLTVNVSAQ